MKTFALTTLAIATLAGAAHGQCTLNRYGVPDFDQRRDALPNNGGYFCVPTSFTNIRGYIANYGYGSIMSGPRNWQSQGNYNYVTARIEAMGVYMDTDPYDGTSGSDAKNGWNDFIDDWHEDKFTLSSWGGYCPGPWIFILFNTGITNMCYGYYKPSGGSYYRDGGHCVTLVGLKNLCVNINEPTFRIRNPASDDGDLDVQSTFSTEETRTDVQSFNYDGDVVTRLRLTDFGSGSSTRRYMDKLYSVQPLIALTGSITSGTAVTLHRPLSLFGQSGHQGSTAGPGASEFVADIALHPMGIESYIVTSQLITNTKRIYRYNMGTGEWGLLLPALGTANCKITTSRFGELFVYGDGSVRKYDVQGASPVLLKTITPVNSIAAMAYDDALDELVAVSTNNRLVRYSQSTLGTLADEPLPGGITIIGDGSVVPSPTMPGHWYIASTGTPTIADITPIPGSPRLQTSALISLPPGTQPKSMKITDTGDIVFINGSAIAEYKRTMAPTGAPTWVLDPDSDFNGLPAARALVISRSRSNLDDRTLSLPEWQDDSYEPEGVVPVPDCVPDLNQDGDVDILDFLDFFNSFEPCQGEAGPCGIDGLNADYNNDGLVDILDMLDFLNDFGNGCS